MKNSICLLLPTSETSPAIKARCFIVFPTDSREVAPYPFTLQTIRELNEARKYETITGSHSMKWCATLFFPEMWPPEIIRSYVEEFKPSIDSGIHLPILSRIDEARPVTRAFIPTFTAYMELPGEPCTSVAIMMAMDDTAEHCERFALTTEWCSVLWFPGHWLPSEVYEYLYSSIYQASLFEA